MGLDSPDVGLVGPYAQSQVVGPTMDTNIGPLRSRRKLYTEINS